MAINITDYKRTGIFIEEDVSILDLQSAPLAPNVHFVPGFSKESKVFNKPVLLTRREQRKNYFGKIDRTLENKGSYFHRTIDTALQTAPVYAMNLLKTTADDTLDYVSLSLAAQYDNSDVEEEQYDKFFNKAGFWNRDTDSFMFFAKDPMKKMHLANVSSSTITFFAFKAKDTSFDLTAEQWYANLKEDVPAWMHPKSLISDYLMRVIVVKGDYTNYTALSVDQTYSKYFTKSGLKKEMVDDFMQENLVTTLGDYTGSVIPYFQDLTGRNIFIESLINVETDKTGLFCAMDIDGIETDFPTGIVDLIGETLVGLDKSKIDYLSYEDKVEEATEYTEQTNLDIEFQKEIMRNFNVVFTQNAGVAFTITDISFDVPTTPSPIPQAYFNGEYKNVDVSDKIKTNTLAGYTTSLSGITYSCQAKPLTSTGTVHRRDVAYINSNGIFEISVGQEQSTSTNLANVAYPNDAYVIGVTDYTFNNGSATKDSDQYEVFTALSISTQITNATTPPLPATPNFALVTRTFTGYTVNPIATSVAPVNSYNPMDPSNALIKYDDSVPTGQVELDFVMTSTNKSDYNNYFCNLLFNEFINNLSTSFSYITLPSGEKYDLSESSIVIDEDYALASPNQKTVTVIFGDSTIANNETDFVYTDKNQDGIGSISDIGFTSETTVPANYVSIGEQSELYKAFINGDINSGDMFYENYGSYTAQLYNYTNTTNPTLIGRYVILPIGSFNVGDQIILKEYSDNEIFEILDDSVDANSLDTTTYPSTGTHTAYLVGNTIETGAQFTTDILDANAKVYLKMYSNGEKVYIDFCADNTLTTAYGNLNIQGTSVKPIYIYSGIENYTQTLEIVNDPNYTRTDTKFLIDASRYGEVKPGDYVDAYYDMAALTAEFGPTVEPKKFARIIKKVGWDKNSTYGTNYAEITTDIKYNTQASGPTGVQTTRYTSVEEYVNTYKGFKLNAFKIDPNRSAPDGTEERQEEILSIIGKDTPLYYAITNKQKFNFRYLIDSFGNGLKPFSKQILMDLAGKRKNCIAFLNTPSAKKFKQSNNPSFINDDGTLNMEFVKNGGDQSKSPSFLYSFGTGSGKDDGRDCSGYFFPWVTVDDNGRPLDFPPASYVANTYMRKTSSALAGKYNFTVAAGVNDGLVLGIADTEMSFTEKDYEEAKKMGLNLISYNSNYGYYLETEFSAMQTPKTPISNLHVRELLIDMENEMYAMLFKYQYKFNIPSIRNKIKREADDICQKYMDRGGITYYKNVIDETNNTPTLIDNQFGLLETTIIPVSAMSTIVNIFHVTTNGALAGTTGFQ